MLQLPANLQSLLYAGRRALRFAHLWTIERVDGTELFFTDHSTSLVFQGDTYRPANGMESTAREQQGALSEQSKHTRGILDSSRISNDDLRKGLYRRARVYEYLIDWRHPFAGSFESVSYWIAETEFDGLIWQAKLVGIERWIRNKTGRMYGSTCDVDLGSVKCGVDLTDPLFKGNGTVSFVSSNSPRRVFRANNLVFADKWFNDGNLTWVTGANAGLKFEVQRYSSADDELVQWLKCPNDVEVGDTFTVTAGCNKQAGVRDDDGDCLNKFGNLDNFRAQEYLPGDDTVYKAMNS